MRWIVTGCRGFLGNSFGCYASSRGDQVLGIARGSQAPFGWQGEYFSADASVSDLQGIFKSFQPDAVLHAAGSASVAASFQSPHDDFLASMGAWSHVLSAIHHSGLRPVIIFPSSAAVYGQPDVLPVSERSSLRPLSPYGYHKLGGEIIAESHAKFFGARIIGARLFSLFGPLQRRLLLWEIYQQIRGGKAQVEIAGTGAESRDFLSVDDVSEVFRRLASLPWKESGFFPINVASGEERTVLSAAETLIRLSGESLPLKCRGEARPGNPDRWAADISHLRSLLPDWNPRSFESSLAETISTWQHEAN